MPEVQMKMRCVFHRERAVKLEPHLGDHFELHRPGYLVPAFYCEALSLPTPRSELVVRRHRSEQYFTFFQSRDHFLRHTKRLPHRMQVLEGSFFLWWTIKLKIHRVRVIGKPDHLAR